MEQITVVIGDRPGKGQKWPLARKSRCSCCCCTGCCRRYEAGRHDESRKRYLRHLLLRRGGAGAITAQNKHGYKAKYGMRSVDEGVTAINEGYNVLGFGFMDKEELGERLVEARKRNTAREYERAIHHDGEREGERRKQNTGLRRRPEPCTGRGDENFTAYLTAY